MDRIFAGIRATDIGLAVVLSGLGVYLMLENMNGSTDDVRVDSTSWLMIPVFLIATAAVLWRRRSVLTVTLVAGAAMAAHVAAFGWDVRCGVGLPLALVLAYSAGRFVTDRVQSALTMALTIGVQVLVLVRDSAAGLDILPISAALGVIAWGIGWFVQSRTNTGVARADDRVPVASHR
ncbi:MAG: hypothetical protein ABIO16_08590 [Nocardioides sp.]